MSVQLAHQVFFYYILTSLWLLCSWWCLSGYTVASLNSCTHYFVLENVSLHCVVSLCVDTLLDMSFLCWMQHFCFYEIYILNNFGNTFIFVYFGMHWHTKKWIISNIILTDMTIDILWHRCFFILWPSTSHEDKQKSNKSFFISSK